MSIKQAVVCANASPVFPPVVQAVPKEDWPVEARFCERTHFIRFQCLPWTSLLAGCMRVSKSVLVQRLSYFTSSGSFISFCVLRFRIPKTFCCVL